MDLFKKKKLKLECYTHMQDLADLFPPQIGHTALPNWYQHLTRDPEKITIRHCSGFQDLYKNSFVIRSWSDIEIGIAPDGGVSFQIACQNEINRDPVQMHPIESQAAGAWPGYVNVKLMSPWYLRTNRLVKWLMIPPTWDQKDPLEWTTVPGVIEFKYQSANNINCLMKIRPEPYMIKIKAGQALAQFVPLFEEDWDMEVKLFDHNDWQKYFGRWNHSFNHTYLKTRSMLEKKG